MPRQANGNYLPPANTAAVTGTTISSTAYNTLETDIGTEITNSVDRGGRSAMTAALPMGGNKITGMADPTVATDATTKNYVDTTTAAFFSTGDVKLTIKTVADSGWLIFDDGTFGSASSGSSNSNNIANLALFTLFFNNISDTAAPILTSGGGATTRAAQVSASAAWAANCRMSLLKTLGRALGISGSGSGLTARALGSIVGAESVALAQGNLPNISLTANSLTMSIFYSKPSIYNIAGSSAAIQDFDSINPGGYLPRNFNIGGQTVPLGGSGTAISLMQPEVFLNAMIKV